MLRLTLKYSLETIVEMKLRNLGRYCICSLVVLIWHFGIHVQTSGYALNLVHTRLRASMKQIVKLQSFPLKSTESDDDTIWEISDEVNSIIDLFLQAQMDGNFASVSPSLLSENSHMLVKGRLYETIMDKRLSQCDKSEDTIALEKVNSFLQGFVNSERKSRARMKVNYILSGAMTNRLDEAIEILVER